MIQILHALSAAASCAALIMLMLAPSTLLAREEGKQPPPAGSHFPFQAAMFSATTGLSAAVGAGAALLQGMALEVMLACLNLVALTIHLTQQERAKKDGYRNVMPGRINATVSASYLLAAAWLAAAAYRSRPTVSSGAAMAALAPTATGIVLLLALGGLKWSKDRPSPMAGLGLAMVVGSLAADIAGFTG